MKRKIIYGLLVAFMASSMAACTTYTAGRSGKVPPGQAKKIYGSKSAKQHAPGQKKKRH